MTAEWIFFKMAQWEKLSSIATVTIDCSTNGFNLLSKIEAKIERSISQLFGPSSVSFSLNLSQNPLIDFAALSSDSSLSAKGIRKSEFPRFDRHKRFGSQQLFLPLHFGQNEITIFPRSNQPQNSLPQSDPVIPPFLLILLYPDSCGFDFIKLAIILSILNSHSLSFYLFVLYQPNWRGRLQGISVPLFEKSL
jgi:hypothetical protein